jgi:hypothetical protein
VVVTTVALMSSNDIEYQHPAVEAVAMMTAGLDAFGEASLWSMSTTDVAQLVIAIERIGRRVAAAQVSVLAQADRSGIADQTGSSSTAVWLHNVADLPVGVGRARLALHRALATRPVVGAAFSAGDIGSEAATVVCSAIDTLPGGVPAALNTEIEVLLVDTARDEGTKAVVQRSMEIAHRFDPDGFELQEAMARNSRGLQLVRKHDGTLTIRGCLDKESAALALAVLDPLAAPLPMADGTPDRRSAELRYADAFLQLCQLATPMLPDVRGERPHMFVTTTLDSLQRKVGSALGTLEGGHLISRGALRRIACDANIIPVVLGSAGQLLDIGRSTRIVPVGLRRALVARDGGCAFPGCDRPPSWCDAHHIDHWVDGGATSLCNLALLCGHHHDRMHAEGWIIKMIDGRPWFIPPPWLDPRTATPTKQPLPGKPTRSLDPTRWTDFAGWSPACDQTTAPSSGSESLGRSSRIIATSPMKPPTTNRTPRNTASGTASQKARPTMSTTPTRIAARAHRVPRRSLGSGGGGSGTKCSSRIDSGSYSPLGVAAVLLEVPASKPGSTGRTIRRGTGD